jgi:hypothetical protein
MTGLNSSKIRHSLLDAIEIMGFYSQRPDVQATLTKKKARVRCLYLVHSTSLRDPLTHPLSILDKSH